MTDYPEKSVCISGIGQSTLFRKPTIYPFDLAIKACMLAIDDAGLTVDDIDGLSMWPGGEQGVGEGFSSASGTDIKNTLGLKLNWFATGQGPGQYASIANAIAAIAAGYCRHVLCWRSEGERWVPTYGRAHQDGAMPVPQGFQQFSMPYWALSAANWIGIHADLHMRKYGLTRQQMAAIPIEQRKNAALNPRAVYRDPLTMDDYMNARMVTTPFCLYDCDVPLDGTGAVIVSRLDAARDLRHKPIRFEAVGTALHDHDSWWLRTDFPNMALHDSAKMLWQRTDLKPKDVTSAHLYDGFTYLTILWMEALGLTKLGETGAFIEGGKRIALDGELPLNTNGGQLSEGRLHAYGHLHEAVLQLRGYAGPRQVKNSKVAVTGAGGGAFGACLLLVRDD